MPWFWESPPPPPPPTLLETLTPDLIKATGWIALVLSLLLTQMPTARSMAVMQTLTNSTYMMHFWLMGAMGGMNSQLVGVANGLLKYNAETSPTCKTLHKALPLVLIPLGSLFQKDYRFLGEDWLTEARREDEHLIAAKNCFITAAMYGGFLGLSVMCCMNNKRRGRM